MICCVAAMVASCIDLSKELQTSENCGSTSYDSQTSLRKCSAIFTEQIRSREWRKENQSKPTNKARVEKDAERRSNNNARER